MLKKLKISLLWLLMLKLKQKKKGLYANKRKYYYTKVTDWVKLRKLNKTIKTQQEI